MHNNQLCKNQTDCYRRVNRTVRIEDYTIIDENEDRNGHCECNLLGNT